MYRIGCRLSQPSHTGGSVSSQRRTRSPRPQRSNRRSVSLLWRNPGKLDVRCHNVERIHKCLIHILPYPCYSFHLALPPPGTHLTYSLPLKLLYLWPHEWHLNSGWFEETVFGKSPVYGGRRKTQNWRADSEVYLPPGLCMNKVDTGWCSLGTQRGQFPPHIGSYNSPHWFSRTRKRVDSSFKGIPDGAGRYCVIPMGGPRSNIIFLTLPFSIHVPMILSWIMVTVGGCSRRVHQMYYTQRF